MINLFCFTLATAKACVAFPTLKPTALSPTSAPQALILTTILVVEIRLELLRSTISHSVVGIIKFPLGNYQPEAIFAK